VKALREYSSASGVVWTLAGDAHVTVLADRDHAEVAVDVESE
jgi:hypothetical protein